MKKSKPNREAVTQKVRELFEYSSYVAGLRPGGFDIEFEDREVSFADLDDISKAFGTRMINMGSETREGGYCETCAYSYSVVVVRVDGIDSKWLEES